MPQSVVCSHLRLGLQPQLTSQRHVHVHAHAHVHGGGASSRVRLHEHQPGDGHLHALALKRHLHSGAAQHRCAQVQVPAQGARICLSACTWVCTRGRAPMWACMRMCRRGMSTPVAAGGAGAVRVIAPPGLPERCGATRGGEGVPPGGARPGPHHRPSRSRCRGARPQRLQARLRAADAATAASPCRGTALQLLQQRRHPRLQHCACAPQGPCFESLAAEKSPAGQAEPCHMVCNSVAECKLLLSCCQRHFPHACHHLEISQ